MKLVEKYGESEKITFSKKNSERKTNFYALLARNFNPIHFSVMYFPLVGILLLVNRFSTWLSSTFTWKWIECTEKKKAYFSSSHPVSLFFLCSLFTASTYEWVQDDLISDDIRQKLRHHYLQFHPRKKFVYIFSEIIIFGRTWRSCESTFLYKNTTNRSTKKLLVTSFLTSYNFEEKKKVRKKETVPFVNYIDEICHLLREMKYGATHCDKVENQKKKEKNNKFLLMEKYMSGSEYSPKSNEKSYSNVSRMKKYPGAS